MNLRKGDQHHVESSVTHRENWCPKTERLRIKFNQKFRGDPKEREGLNTDFAKGRRYDKEIEAAYREVGFDPEKVQRWWCCWNVKDRQNLDSFLGDYRGETGLAVQILWFPDLMDELLAEVGTSNYDDEVLRTMSLIRQLQKRKAKMVKRSEGC